MTEGKTMIRKVYLKNFLSLGELEVDFQTKDSCKTKILVYGENGVGKSNFIDSLAFLKTSISTFVDVKDYMEITKRIKNYHDDIAYSNDGLILFDSISELAEVCYSIGGEGDMILVYEFLLGKGVLEYSITIDNSYKIRDEKIRYSDEKRIRTLLKITKEDDQDVSIRISDELMSSLFRKQMEILVQQFWGEKHSFLALLNYSMKKSNHAFVSQNTSVLLRSIIHYIDSLHISTESSHIKKSGFGETNFEETARYYYLIEGKCLESDIKNIKAAEKALNSFFTRLYSDILALEYEITPLNEKNYTHKLYVKKRISGKIVRIPFSDESTGTKSLLFKVLPIIDYYLGGVVLIDEIDTGIHDLTIENLVGQINPNTQGQLIITTHNTNLMNKVPVENVYLLRSDEGGRKSLKSISKSEVRQTNNLSKMYREGLFGGTPYDNLLLLDMIAQDYKEES